MDLNFNKVSYDGELTDLSEEQLRETVKEFETAQESNVAEFNTAADALDGVDESTIEDFEDARASLLADITEADAFGDVPVTEETLQDADFSDLQDWKDFLASESVEDDESPTDDDDESFEDFGQEAPTNPDEDDVEDFADEELGQIAGLNPSN